MVRVVIVGASFGGLRVHHLLKQHSDIDVTLISASEFMEFTPGVLRVLVEPQHANSILVPHPGPMIPGLAVKAQMPSSTGAGQVELACGKVMPWDHLVIATGSSYANPIRSSTSTITYAQRLAELQAAAQQLHAASSVVIVGGGPVGVELAAEIVGTYGNTKRVTLITSQDRLLHRMAPRARQYAERWLRSRGVQLLFSERVVTWPEGALHAAVGGEVVTSSGRRLAADLVYNCTCVGNRVNVELYLDLIQGQHVDDHEAVVERARTAGIPVEDTLQAKGLPRVWVVGDAADLPFEKCAYAADLQAGCVAANVVRHIQGKHQELLKYPQGILQSGNLVSLQEPPNVQVISLYRHHAVMQISRTVMVGWLPALAKRLVEACQLGMARGNQHISSFWMLNEWFSTWVVTQLNTRTSTW